ncbi:MULTISPECIES: hypothetical protein [unclassified Luteococcus]|uniref:hypothetical protein n=1 Tax=unclassified Luteococcus TaxID=2639923 RepID=UPI00313AB4CB
MASPRRNSLLALLVAIVLLVVGAGWLVNKITSSVTMVVPPAEQCTVSVGEVSDTLSLEQSENAAIIVAESIRRGLPARAASIALATAKQESKLRNIDYGDRDSVGLFQQRPSQGWGTVEQIMDPWYSTGKFYDGLVKVPGWESGDINDVAQEVQKSGVPEGYRKHVEVSKAWASALTGHSPATVSCIDRRTEAPSTNLAETLLTRAFNGSVKHSQGQARLTLNSANQQQLWAATQLTLTTTRQTGITGVAVGQRTLTLKGDELAQWTATSAGQEKPTEATITLRA